MRNVILICGMVLAWSLSPLKAGSVNVLGNAPESDGKLTLEATAIQVQTDSASVEVNLTDVLEADFGETPFHLDYFTSNGATGSQLPPDWKAQDIGKTDNPGSFTYANGTLTLNAWERDAGNPKGDQFFFIGKPWTGDGQWTARVTAIGGNDKVETEAGLMQRNSLEDNSMEAGLGLGSGGYLRNHFRSDPKQGGQYRDTSTDLAVPIWLRLTRQGVSVQSSVSSDGKQWDLIGQNTLPVWAEGWAGFYIDSHKDKAAGNAVMDQITFAPAPSPPETVFAGVLLRSGSFLAGTFNSFNMDPANTAHAGDFQRNGKSFPIPLAQIAAIVWHPVTLSQIAAVGSENGVLLKNGDFLAADLSNANRDGVEVSSLVLGITRYDSDAVSAYIVHQPQPQPSDYEVRLRDGSVLRAKSFAAKADQIGIEDISGLGVTVAPEEIAQIRAGLTHAQPLFDLPWKAIPPPATAVAATNPAPATNAAPLANAAPAPNIPPDPNASIQTWIGPNHEQILVAPTATPLEFPLTGKFREISLRVAISPDSPPNSQVTLRVLADGKEVARTPPFKSGEEPRFVEATVDNPQTVTLVADSFFGGARVLFIDPLAIRQD